MAAYDWPEGYVPGSGVHLPDVFTPTVSPNDWWYNNPADPTDAGHAKSHRQEYLEWIKSKHSQALDTLKASDDAAKSCLACHSEDYRRDRDNVTLDNAQFSVECATCHATHSPGQEGTSQLIKKPYDLCVECHNATSSGAHPIQIGAEVHTSYAGDIRGSRHARGGG